MFYGKAPSTIFNGLLALIFYGKAPSTIFNGLLALILSMIIWKLTGNLWGWLVLFTPGMLLVFYGWYLIFKEE